MKLNNVEELKAAFDKFQSLQQMMNGDKSELIKKVAGGNSNLSGFADILNLAKGGNMASLFSAFQNRNSAASAVANTFSEEKTAPVKTGTAHYGIKPIVNFATKEIIQDIVNILSK